MPPNDLPAVHRVEQAIEYKTKGGDTIFLGDLNACMGDPHNEREEELATALDNHGLGYVTSNFTPRQRYKGQGQCMWNMHREGHHVTGKVDYVIGTGRGYFANAGMREPRLNRYHRMMLVVIRGEGMARKQEILN